MLAFLLLNGDVALNPEPFGLDNRETNYCQEDSYLFSFLTPNNIQPLL